MDAEEILIKAAEIQKERGVQRDAPDGERSMVRAVKSFNALTGKGLTETDGWLLLMQLKASRAQHGVFVADDYDDLVGYASLYAESAYREEEEAEQDAKWLEEDAQAFDMILDEEQVYSDAAEVVPPPSLLNTIELPDDMWSCALADVTT